MHSVGADTFGTAAMAKSSDFSFDQRVGRIVRYHKSLQRGAVTQIGPDGLLTVRPRRTSLRLPWRGLVMSLLMVIVVKAGLFAYLGAEAYSDKIVQLQAGYGVEQFGAWMLAPDFATEALAAFIAPLL